MTTRNASCKVTLKFHLLLLFVYATCTEQVSTIRREHTFIFKQFLFIFSGGLVFIPQKHKEGARVKYNSGFFLTTNHYPDFGDQRDCDAIRARLEIFTTSSLQGKSDKSVTGKFMMLLLLFVVKSSHALSCTRWWVVAKDNRMMRTISFSFQPG